ncbi:PXA domain-containing protein [Xylaria venustula]|nr:PXA domain-containing protein [Xylaria venustula]
MAIPTSSIPSIGAGGPFAADSNPPTTTSAAPAEHIDAAATAKTTAAATAGRGPSTSASVPDSASVSVSASASPSNSAPLASPPDVVSSAQPHHHRATRPASSDFLSDKATAALIRRCLCARHPTDRGRGSPTPIQDLLPPLTSRNDVDLQLYALISIVIREFVQNWYNKITPDDTFVAEIVQIIAHCTRAFEQRLRKIDLESLLFDELPELLAAHVQAYRVATRPAAKPPLQTELHQIYHSLHPLPALSPVPRAGDQASVQAQADNESAYRQLLVHGVLAVLLPTEDLENECLTSLVGQILSELVIGNLVAGKLSEPWLVWELLIMTTRLVRKRSNLDGPGHLPNKASTVEDSGGTGLSTTKNNKSWSPHQAFWSAVSGLFLVGGMIRLAFSLWALSWSLSPRPNPSAVYIVHEMNHDTEPKDIQFVPSQASIDTNTQSKRIAVIDFHMWRCMGDILEVDARMPWLRGTFSMIQWIAMKGPGRVAAHNGTLDRLLSHYIHTYVLDPARLSPLLRAIRAALFPNNAPGVSSLKPPSSGEQLAALRRRCASALLGLLPKAVGELYYGTSKWAWSGVRADTTTSESLNPRADRLKRSSSILYHSSASNISATDAGPPHVSPDGNNSMMPNDATLSSQPKGHSHGPNESDHTLPERGNEEEARRLSEIETGIVDIFSDAYCNKHLVYGILELILVRLVPELAEKGVGELWEERLH